MGKELDKVRGEKVTLKIKGKEREIKYSFSAWAVLEKEYGGIKNLERLEKKVEEMPFNTLPHLLYVGLVDKDGVTEENILDDYGIQDIEYIANVWSNAINASLPQETKKAVMEAKK